MRTLILMIVQERSLVSTIALVDELEASGATPIPHANAMAERRALEGLLWQELAKQTGWHLRAKSTVRLSTYAVWPGFVDAAQRVEQGAAHPEKPHLGRQRLDGALTRKRLVIEQGVAPTRLLQIEA